MYKEQIDRLSKEVHNDNFYVKHVEQTEHNKKEYNYLYRQTFKNKKSSWLDINPLAPFQETGSVAVQHDKAGADADMGHTGGGGS